MEGFIINNTPNVNELWAGIGGHFDSLGQIVNEFIDNSISNFTGKNTDVKNIIIKLEELDNKVKISIEDTGTGILNIDTAFTLGGKGEKDSPLNEHGFGLKHAFASANPNNDAWYILTRTEKDVSSNQYTRIEAPYKLENFQASIITNTWPGDMNGTGTIVCFECSKEMYRTLGKGFKGGIRDFERLADILCEDIGFIYSEILKSGNASISMKIKPIDGTQITRSIGAVEPDWNDYFAPGKGEENTDLGAGTVKIKYQFGRINDKANRTKFDNSTTDKYYKRSISSSGVEIRINGRVLTYNLFKEIWGLEKHNSYNDLLIIVDLVSNNAEALPKTRTSKNGLREGDPLLENLFNWIKSKYPNPVKNTSISEHETDLFEQLAENFKTYGESGSVVKTEMNAFNSSGTQADLVRIDLYKNSNGKTTIYEGKKDTTTSKDVYQLRLYWDGLVYDGIKPDLGVLVASDHPSSVKSIMGIVNTMKDANGNNYHFETKTWLELGIKYDHGSL